MTTLAYQLRSNDGCAPQPVLTWDSVWDPASGTADWAYAGAAENDNIGGLQAQHAIETAVILSLFTDRRCPDGHPLAWLIEDGDLRGWWGDGVDLRDDLGETPTGSLLWLLTRATATPANANWARLFALEALQPMIDGREVARVDVQTELPSPGRLYLAVQIYGRDGARVYDRRFDDIWAQRLT